MYLFKFKECKSQCGSSNIARGIFENTFMVPIGMMIKEGNKLFL